MPEDHERPERTEGDREPRADEPTERIRFLSGDLSESAASGAAEGDRDSSSAPHRDEDGAPEGADDLSERDTKPRMRAPEQLGSTEAVEAVPDERPGGSGNGPEAGTGTGARSEEEPESDSERTDTIPVVPPEPVPAEQDTERTESIPVVTDKIPGPVAEPATTQVTSGQGVSPQAAFGHPGGEPPQLSGTEQYRAGQGGEPPFGMAWGTPGAGQQPEAAGGGDSRRNRTLLRALVAAGFTIGLLALLYIGDLAFSSGAVPRGTTVAGVDVGGLDRAAAERKLRSELDTTLSEPVELRVGKAQSSIDPQAAGLSMDWKATLDEAGSQPLNPVTRVTSFFTTREVTPVSNVDRESLRNELTEARSDLHREPVEGTIRFEGSEPTPVFPVTGRNVNVDQAMNVVVRDWASKGPVQLPFTTQEVNTTEAGVRRALENVAKPAVSGPVTVNGDGVQATLAPADIASALRFEPNDSGGLKWNLDVPSAKEVARPQLKSTLEESKSASFKFEDGKPKVQPSKKGREIDWKKTFAPLDKKLTESGSDTVEAVYTDVPADLTTEKAKSLGIEEKVSTFTTKGFSKDSGTNIRRVAQEVDGAIVKPGETFSLNGHTGVRQKEQGYVASGIIKNGRPDEAVGGGISQFATTLFNASYFAGMKDVEHSEHSYYISRYPMGREATVFQRPDGTSVIDVKFKNVSDSGILIRTKWTPDSITVTFWGTKQYDVKSKTGDKTDVVKPEKKKLPAGEECISTKGKEGFTVHDTRVRKNLKTGEVTRNREKTVYEPQPIVECVEKPKD
ncbi:MULTISPECIES: VanW family protein [unclassified Actinopolyspora]|uniref:VanW family protein n=1 Tax=unclassified Actinopolyspora TaxID=2639451 RepID=UPI0013F5C435|nr:vanomycin resistance protein VanB [Actinopolyspora sp. BKK2]NHE77444.1 vanomycin resistance protein VanB [Actinopolyspora sp. BKK1]